MTVLWQLSRNENITACISGCPVGPAVPRPWLISLLGLAWRNDIHLPAGPQSHSLSYVTAHLVDKYFTSFSPLSNRILLTHVSTWSYSRFLQRSRRCLSLRLALPLTPATTMLVLNYGGKRSGPLVESTALSVWIGNVLVPKTRTCLFVFLKRWGTLVFLQMTSKYRSSVSPRGRSCTPQ